MKRLAVALRTMRTRDNPLTVPDIALRRAKEKGLDPSEMMGWGSESGRAWATYTKGLVTEASAAEG